jgi:AcrR family transcriptional regulator
MSREDSRRGRERGRTEQRTERVERKTDQERRKMEDARRKLDEAEGNVTRKLDEADRKVARGFERAQRELDRAERELERTAGPIWARPEPGARRARFTREQIAEAALAVADKEGFDAVSMRRVAAELDAGTMTLYHYVRTKDELVALMDDAIMGELLIPDDELPSDWREALTAIARRTRDAFARHPWSLYPLGEAQIGPNAMRHVEQSVAAVAELDLGLTATFEIVGLVDEYVFGYAMRGRDTGPDDPEARERWLEQVVEYMEAEIATGDYPHLAALVPEGGMVAAWEQLQESEAAEDRFERGLKRLLDGIELDLKNR